jgi:hypothetical protein
LSSKEAGCQDVTARAQSHELIGGKTVQIARIDIGIPEKGQQRLDRRAFDGRFSLELHLSRDDLAIVFSRRLLVALLNLELLELEGGAFDAPPRVVCRQFVGRRTANICRQSRHDQASGEASASGPSCVA